MFSFCRIWKENINEVTYLKNKCKNMIKKEYSGNLIKNLNTFEML